MVEIFKRQDRFVWIDYLKMCAALLITNSHCQNIYPLSYLSVGGTFGNALFFIISGYLLINIRTSFITWYYNRVKRLLPSTLLCLSVNVIFLLDDDIQNFTDLKKVVVYYLDLYWFVWTILIYYMIYFPIIRQALIRKSVKPITITLFVWIVGYIVLYSIYLHQNNKSFFVELSGFDFFKVYNYFGVFILGALFRTLQNKFHCKTCLALLICISGACIWAFEYGMIYFYNQYYSVQFIIHLGVLIFAFFAIVLFSQLKIRKVKIVSLIASSTLEIYLMQITFLALSLYFSFPVNWICHFSIAFIGGVLFHLALNKLYV